jgi:group I intron endonuclease
MPYYIYKITNQINEKIYIGKTLNIQKRWNSHKTAARQQKPNDFSYLHRAMTKYGFDNFTIEEIESYDTEQEALSQETYYISHLQSNNRDIGYNLTIGGDGVSGYKHTEEFKRRKSKDYQGRNIGKENPFYGKNHTEKFKLNHSQYMRLWLKNNKDIYIQLNTKQCNFSTEQCLAIQRQYLEGNISFEQLAKDYSTNLHTIHNIIHGTYFAIKDKSIITEQMFQEIKCKRKIQQSNNSRKFSDEEEKMIIQDYLEGASIKELTTKYSCSSPSISKVLKQHHIITQRGKKACSIQCHSKTEPKKVDF